MDIPLSLWLAGLMMMVPYGVVFLRVDLAQTAKGCRGNGLGAPACLAMEGPVSC